MIEPTILLIRVGGGGGGYILFPGHILGDCKEEGGERGGGHLGKD